MVFITAEIGINHNGDINTTKKLIDIAVRTGCDAVKFQKRTVEKVYSKEILDSPRESPWGTTTREQKLGLEFEKKEYDVINSYTKEKGIEWYAVKQTRFNMLLTHFRVPSAFWQLFWCCIYGPYLLYRIRNVHDTHYWRAQTILCVISG